MTELLSRRTGFALVCAIVLFISLWLATAGRQAVKLLNTPARSVPAIAPSTDLARFRADAFYLPDEALLGFVVIPAGEFSMGSDPDVAAAYENERWSETTPQGRVELPIFYIARYEVTVAQYREFVQATGRPFDRQSLLVPPTHPVSNVTFSDAISYAKWLDAALRSSAETPAPLARLLAEGWRVALPNEAEWEKAARGFDGRLFPWGNAPSRDYANYSSARTQPVGSLRCPSCAFQLADMSGNVREFTATPYAPYPFDVKFRGDPSADALYVMRGGSFADEAQNVRAAVRGRVGTDIRRGDLGFRIAIVKRQ